VSGKDRSVMVPRVGVSAMNEKCEDKCSIAISSSILLYSLSIFPIYELYLLHFISFPCL
jgi:hypothetical protein